MPEQKEMIFCKNCKYFNFTHIGCFNPVCFESKANPINGWKRKLNDLMIILTASIIKKVIVYGRK